MRAFQRAEQGLTAITLDVVGRDQFPSCVGNCGFASAYVINDSLTVTITPPAA
ncbi:MAG: hypothetical protein ACLR8Y_02315 [Alistipes indistinctus]